ncbi:hypothetical protein D3867_17015 (plasmid) [Azospirillum argentinense]|uniref:Uncharacterized protein n=1 Tax=Azospirillum brasilense TaxID=192 RepID=A0A4D8Q2D7_AZOBR|nr:hypothetical protein D3867_17015 [Azospirillum argentinense]
MWIDGEPWIAKPRGRDNPINHQRVEAACMSVARQAGIAAPYHRLMRSAAARRC